MCAFSLLSEDVRINEFINKINSEDMLEKHIDFMSFIYGRYKYKLSEYQLKVIYTVSTYSLLKGSDVSFKFEKLGYNIGIANRTKYGKWLSLKYYIPLLDRDIPNPFQINWVKVKDPLRVLSLLTDNEMMDVTDSPHIPGFLTLMSRFELIEFVFDNMKKERFRYIKRNLVVCDQDEIYNSEFAPYGDQSRRSLEELTYGIQSSYDNNAYMKCINEDSLAEYFNNRKGFYAPYNNNRLTPFDVDYLEENTTLNNLRKAINKVKSRSNQNLVEDLFAENEQNVIDFIRNIFYAGMYIRRWKGEGHEYPIEYDSTRISICAFFKEADPEYLKNAILASPESFGNRIVESVKSNNFDIEIDSNAYLQYSFENYIRGHLEKVRKNIDIQPDLGVLLLEGESFKSYYTKLMNSELCIRVSSKYLVLLAWELAKFLRDHIDPNAIIPNFNDRMASTISYVGAVPSGESENPRM